MKPEHVTNKGTQTTRIPNKLSDEISPYLLQHAYNPVNWYPWGDEAFEKAKKENKPIFLSVGYSLSLVPRWDIAPRGSIWQYI